MGKYHAYDEYIDSGVGWLGQVPKHWERTTFKHLLEMMVDNRGRTPPTYDDGIPLLEAKHIDGTLKYTSTNFDKFIDKDGHAGFIRDDVKENDILFITVGTIGKTCLVPKSPDFVIAQNIVALRAKDNCNPIFLLFWLRSITARESMLATNKDSILDSIKISDFVQSRLYVPVIAEQQKIANFLDHETAKIDTLIEKQQQLIKLLKEKRQAVISHAVTKGLNPNALMCDSGVEWLGGVPEHWAMPKVSHIGRVLNGSTPDKTNLSYWEDGTIPWLASGCLNSEIVEQPSLFISEGAYENCSVELIPANSLLVGMVGQGKTRGTSAILAFDSCINQNMAAIIPNDKIQTRFLYYLFHAMYDDLRELGRGGNQAALNCEIIGSVRIPLPPIEEQIAVVEMLDHLLIKLGNTDRLGLEQIELLQERRTALISAAVTGKIDVRNWLAPEPLDNRARK